MKKRFAIVVILLMFVLATMFSACFTNPGDQLGGGGTGDIATAQDTSEFDAVKEEIKGKTDLSKLAANTEAGEKVYNVAASDEVVEVKESATYIFKGNYGGIFIAKKELKLHFIFDGATITREKGVAIDGTEYKKTELVITLKEGTTNTVSNDGDGLNAIHIKGSLAINGKGTLNVTSDSKSALKATKEIQVVDATLNLTAASHAVTGASVAASNCAINVLSAGKDGINAECDEAKEFTTEDGFVAFKNVNYTCNVYGDGIQADTVVYVDGGNYNITTTGNFVELNADNMAEYGMTVDDFRYIYSGGKYKKVDSDYRTGGAMYGLSQGCKGIKAGEIEYTDDDDKTVVVTEGKYLIAIDGGTFNINSTDDAIHANSGNIMINGGTFELSTFDDAITSGNLTKITGGNINITASYEGIEGAYVEISGGTVNLVASDDGINAASDARSVNAHIIISGGDITVNANGDGIDSNGSILISGGRIVVHGPTTGRDAGLDADRGIVVTGGTLFATSTLGMVETPSSNSEQYVVSYAHQSTITAGSVVSLRDKKGNVLISVTVLKNCQSIIMSCADLKKDSTYYIYGGDTKITSFKVSSIITTIGSAGNSFPGGGRPGGPGGGPGGRP